MKLFKITSDTKVCSSTFVDWYNADSQDETLAIAKEDAHRYGLPANTEFTVVECDTVTLKPLTN